MARTFDADEIQLNLIRLLSGTADPTSGGGLVRVVGSLYARAQAGAVALYQKLTAPNTGWQALVQGLAWKSVKDYGATGDGVTDDTASIQQAITDVAALGGGVVYVPQGTYVVSQLAITGATGVQMIGAGSGSVLKWVFNAGGVAGSLLTISAGCLATVIENLRFDGSGLTNPEAARGNHLIRVDGTAGAVTETQIVGCEFVNMAANSGDGVHVIGAAGNLVSRLWVRQCVFNACSRFGVGVRQGWQYGWILDNFLTGCETEIGFVSTANVNTDSIQIQGNIISHTSVTVRHGMRIEADATGLLTRIIVAENFVIGGFATFSNLQYASIDTNEIFSGAFASADPVVHVFGVFQDSLLNGNLIDRDPSASAGPCLTCEKSTNAPTRFGVRNNILIQEVATAGFLVFVDCTRFAASGNQCRGTNAGATTVMAIDCQAVTVALDDCMIGPGNQISAAAGTYKAAVRLLANGANVSGAVLIGCNIANQIDSGVQYEIGGGGGNFTGNTILAGNNNWTAGTSDFVNVNGAAVVPRVGFNAGTFGAQLFEGDGDPNGVVTARVGSMYLRRDGGQATSVYYKETGTGNTGWVGIGGTPIFWGVGDTTTASTAVFFAPGYIATAPAAEIQASMTRPGTIRNLRVQVAGAGTGAQTVTFTVRKNGADTTLTCQISNTSTGLTSDTTHTFTVVSTDLISISIVKAAGVAAGQTNVIATYELN